MGCVNQKWSQSRPTRAVSSNCNMFIQFTFPATHFCLLSPARDTTQSRLFQFLSSKAGSSIKSPCNCQELCNSVIRPSKPVGNEGPWGSEGRAFRSYMWNCKTKLLPKHLLCDHRAWFECPRLSGWYRFPVVKLTGHSTRLTAPSLSRKGTAQMYFPPPPIIILLQQMLTGKAMWLFHFRADFTSMETKILQSHFCVPRLPSASLSAN